MQAIPRSLSMMLIYTYQRDVTYYYCWICLDHQNSILYVQIGLIIVICKRTLNSKDSLVLLPRSQCSFLIFFLVCLFFVNIYSLVMQVFDYVIIRQLVIVKRNSWSRLYIQDECDVLCFRIIDFNFYMLLTISLSDLGAFRVVFSNSNYSNVFHKICNC